MKTLRNKRAGKASEEEETLATYDFSTGERPRYAEKFPSGATITIMSSNGSVKKKRITKRSLVILDDDVSKVFSDTKSVNAALRHLIAALPVRAQRAA